MSYAIITYNDEYLEHHGIAGQKWGVRRYQNPDGTLTEAGKKKYYIDSDGSLKKMNRKNLKKYDYKKTDTYKNAASRQKATQTNVYNSREWLIGKTAAKKAHALEANGVDAKKFVKKEMVKDLAIGTAAGLVMLDAQTGGNYAKAALRGIGKMTIKAANAAKNAAAEKAARDAVTKIGMKKLVHVAGNVYKYA